MKRPNSSDSFDLPTPKKSKTTSIKKRYLHHREAGAILSVANPQDPTIPDTLLTKALSVVLHYHGFQGVKKDALESFKGVVDSCKLNLASSAQSRDF